MPLGALPVFAAAGTLLDSATMPGTGDVNVPAHNSGDLLVLLCLCRNTNNDGTLSAINTAGWAQGGGAGNMYGGAQNARIGFGWKIGDGSETVVNITRTGGTGTDRVKARVFRFTAADGFNPTSPVQFIGTATNNAAGTTVTAPTVTPGGTKCLAVALFGMSVSTTMAAPTNESGGDWTEPIAESAGVNGTIGILRSDQSGGGTISGGTFTITSAAWVGIGFGLVPADLPNLPETGSLALVGVAPTVSGSAAAAPGLATAVISGHAPTVTTATNVTAQPSAGVAAVTGLATSIASSALLAPSEAILAAVGQEPTVAASSQLNPSAGIVGITCHAPDVSAGVTVSVQPGVGTIAVTGAPPSVSIFLQIPPASWAVVPAGSRRRLHAVQGRQQASAA